MVEQDSYENLRNHITDAVRDCCTRNLQLGKKEVANKIAGILLEKKMVDSPFTEAEQEIADYVAIVLRECNAFFLAIDEKIKSENETTE